MAFLPVILGGDVGAYAIAREFNDAYHIKPLCVTSYNPLAIRDSAILTRVPLAHANDENRLVAGLIHLAEKLESQGAPRLLLVANTDWRIQVMVNHREELEKHYLVVAPPKSVVDHVSNKQEFARIAATIPDMLTPPTLYQDFSDADEPDWTPKPLPAEVGFPLVAKPATSSDYETLVFPGRKKVYYIQNQTELNELWHTLRTAGFRGVFAAQRLIPGDDEYMHSITAYVNSSGATTMLCHARVLLEEHQPATLGNPCAMVTSSDEKLFVPAAAFLEKSGYRGFANFDVKQDPRDGRFYFFEVNPRIGRNSFYCVGAGVNPMRMLVSDFVEHQPMALQQPEGHCLYSIIPEYLLLRYATNPAEKAEIKRLYRTDLINPLDNPRDASLKRRLYLAAGKLSQVRKFLKYYPHPTKSSF
ncbi:MAG: hypothetical protein U0K19_02245 [Bifidobacteriaceae bacterium]|nr:hypothetical protein [Bifidobacteriaceae bacterium]